MHLGQEALSALDEAIDAVGKKRGMPFHDCRDILMRAHRACALIGDVPANKTDCYAKWQYLKSIDQLLGKEEPPKRSWRDEWIPLMIEWLRLNGYASLANIRYVCDNNSVETNICDYTHEIDDLIRSGWRREDAEACTLLTNDGRPGMARALREGSAVYAVSTRALNDLLLKHARAQESMRQLHGSPVPARLFRNMRGRLGLMVDDPNWAMLDAELLRFRQRAGRVRTASAPISFTSSAAVKAESGPQCFLPEGFAVRNTYVGGQVVLLP